MITIGIDIGKVSFKAAKIEKKEDKTVIKDSFFMPHRQDIENCWNILQKQWDIKPSDRILTTGRFRKSLPFPSIVEKAAQERAGRFLYPSCDITIIRLGGGGFSVLNLNKEGLSDYSLNPRCAAGVGTFLDQIMSRIDCDIIKADKLARNAKAVDITKRCGVTMKTDFTHLLNAGHDIEEVVAGLLDASAKSAIELASKKGINPKVLIIGGLSVLKRIQNTIRKSLGAKKEVLVPESSLYFEALGAAIEGLEEKYSKKENIDADSNVKPPKFLPPLSKSLAKVHKCSKKQQEKTSNNKNYVAGIDIGSTGSKIVVFNGQPVFEDYTETSGRPVEAARKLLKKIPRSLFNSLKAVGITGSGREIVSGALKASLPEEKRPRIFVLNEIAAHAAGAHYYDPEVDTVVDIGGQDAKYTRLDSGRVIDSCMNTVCSAGTGSFLAEQLSSLGIKNIEEFGKIALEAPRAVDLGQHCAVFISEQIDEAKRRGAEVPEIVAGLYYSIVLNYDNRVKGNRDYGKKIFMQGKPATNTALAAALSAVTGKEITVPPSPGTPGALGIAVLAKREIESREDMSAALNLKPFLSSRVIERKTFRCRSKDGCTEGNMCPIQRIKLKSGDKEEVFFWGGACDKFEEKPKKEAKIAKAPDPFAEREKLIQSYIKPSKSKTSVGIPRGLENEEILPFSITFFQELGFSIKLTESDNFQPVEEGSRLCESTFCAPLQIIGGQAKMQENEDFIFFPKILEISDSYGKENTGRCYACPLSQAAPDMFSPKINTKILSPTLNLKEGIKSNIKTFLELKEKLGRSLPDIRRAFKKALSIQDSFSAECQKSGKRALKFADKNNIPAVVLLGHPYIINSSLIRAGIPEALRESGAISLPASSYPLKNSSPPFESVFWGYGQKLLQIAEEIRKKPGIYPVWLSVYSCGPDSFLIHFFQYISKGKPYAILESDAYTGKAGFKTRIEAFVYGINNYQPPEKEQLPDFRKLQESATVLEAIKSNEKILIPWMGESSITTAAVLNSIGAKTSSMPVDTREHLELGRKYTSGKECLPMIITLGGLLKFLSENSGNYYYLMPSADGPCRFGKYHLLIKIALMKAGFADRVKIISPSSVTGYS
ncbi:MAG: BadF/BadG/BcrA/BcrD ATPase family protein, partial [Elusimicrobiota bacterium]